jgi:hypothetical protein
VTWLLGFKVHDRFGNTDGNEVEMLGVDWKPHDGSAFLCLLRRKVRH